ncbi:hypothetical protein [Streptomyces sp. NPDC001435]|uniref:hypothetical protein n=1 Tax=unclassified Streptomyces TaxID=2593676 RepID=UPI00367F836F
MTMEEEALSAKVKTLESLVRDLAESVASEEIAYFDQVTRLCVINPASMDLRPGRGKETNGFGVGGASVVVTALAYAVLFDLAKDAAKTSAGNVLSRVRSRLARRGKPAVGPSSPAPAYSAEEVLWAKTELARRLIVNGRTAEEAEAAADRLACLMKDL